jgi:hypothetical protein
MQDLINIKKIMKIQYRKRHSQLWAAIVAHKVFFSFLSFDFFIFNLIFLH